MFSRTPNSTSQGHVAALMIAAALAAGCGGSDGTAPEPQAPVITVQGVSDGAVVEGPVSITISVSVGTYAATLNGISFFSGSTVSDPGSYVLRVEAQNGVSTSQSVVSFEIRLAGGSVLVIRVFDLGDNSSGGGGDAILLSDSTAAGQRHMMIDAGPAGVDGTDLDFVQGRLAALGVDTLEALLLTHAHTDHFDGMTDILREVHVRTFYNNGQVRSFSRYNELLSLAASRADQVTVASEMVDIALGFSGASNLRIIPPRTADLADPDAGSSELNDGSLGTALTRGGFTMFFAGDGEVEANLRWRNQFADLTQGVVALKVGHHGANDAVFDSGSSGTSSWLSHSSPRLQIISANGKSHPRIRALDVLLARADSETYCTNVHGDIEIRVDEKGAYTVVVERNAAMDCVPGDDATS